MFKILGGNFFKYDWIIYVWVILTAVLFALTIKASGSFGGYLDRDFESSVCKSEELQKRHKEQEITYALYLNFVSAFPLLGMIGTVYSLLKLDLSGGTELISGNFLVALTSTLLGAFFGLIFKVLDSFLSPKIEENNELYLIRIKDKKQAAEMGDDDEKA
ncbi:MAG: MotA/TolQ/ExbB proton channel family protein [Ruminococcus sp.]|nr:MotA/TolQ/ExbB proton channel family protein [Ruminococcus sp.]MCM1382235.1 MotA/TolQ/ExbB proton channel family protein [Muribaculaceae bacterium]MCM1479256.1 MotA/TolQ/ExbB proton channel family protein [Muribaculaceae bacterium]